MELFDWLRNLIADLLGNTTVNSPSPRTKRAKTASNRVKRVKRDGLNGEAEILKRQAAEARDRADKAKSLDAYATAMRQAAQLEQQAAEKEAAAARIRLRRAS